MIPIIIAVIILVGTSLLVNTRLIKKAARNTVINTTPGLVQITSPKPESTPPAPTIKSSPIPSQTPKKVESITDLKYPSSTQVSQNGNTTIYESTDDSDIITNWYKQKIESLNMNVKSFVTTKTNGNVLNKLVGADENREIRVEITKRNGPKVTITVTF